MILPNCIGQGHVSKFIKQVSVVDSVLQNAGLNLAVAAMKVGELASVRVQPKYGYGTQGLLLIIKLQHCVSPSKKVCFCKKSRLSH